MIHRLLVLEEPAEDFARAILALELADLEVSASSEAQPIDDLSRADLLLARPDLAVGWLAELDDVRWVQSTWAGVGSLPAAIAGRGIALTGVKEVFGPLIAEHVLAYLLGQARYSDHYAQAQRRKRWSSRAPDTLAGKAMLILGTGSIGQYLAKMVRAFGVHVTGVSRSGLSKAGFDEVLTVADMNGAMSRVDYLVSTLPETPATTGLLDRERLAGMKRGAYVINVGRASTLDHAGLVELLERGHLAGAALDVFEEEPLPADSPLWTARNVTITPHVAAVSDPAAIARVFAENYRRFRRGEPLLYEFDCGRGY